jgi:hypothetical protein
MQRKRPGFASAVKLPGQVVDAHLATAIAVGECRRRHREDHRRHGDEQAQ